VEGLKANIGDLEMLNVKGSIRHGGQVFNENKRRN